MPEIIMHVQMRTVEIRRFSITRLKRDYASAPFARHHHESWNKKILDYEIETWHAERAGPTAE